MGRIQRKKSSAAKQKKKTGDGKPGCGRCEESQEGWREKDAFGRRPWQISRHKADHATEETIGRHQSAGSHTQR